MNRTISSGLLVILLGIVLVSPAAAGNIPGSWQKITGDPHHYSGVVDGIMEDRENSYAWAMEVFDGYLWVGTNRNIFGTMFSMGAIPIKTWPEDVPVPSDMRPRIYRMDLATGTWENFYTSPVIMPGPPKMGMDAGYRMMKTYRSPDGREALYVGSLGMKAWLIAIDGDGQLTRVFSSAGVGYPSIRAIAPHDGKLFWATQDTASGNPFPTPAVWYSPDPLGEFRMNPGVVFPKVAVPSAWLAPGGGEILDMVSYNDALYVFFIPYREDTGFWCGKLVKNGDSYDWQLIVGDKDLGARYPAGMGRTLNGGAVPVVFGGKVYVGTMDGAAFRLMNGFAAPEPGDVTMGGLNGMQIFRFDRSDRWERVMPWGIVRSENLEDRLSGFMNPANKYIWRFGILGNRLYAGTFDIGTGSQLIADAMEVDAPKLSNPKGFDLYWTTDGRIWLPVTITGFRDKWNYGARTFATDPATGTLFLGTANPFYGCQVWKKTLPGPGQASSAGKEFND